MAIRPIYVSDDVWKQSEGKRMKSGKLMHDFLADETNRDKVIKQYGDATPAQVDDELPDLETGTDTVKTETKGDIFESLRTDTDKPSEARRKSEELAKLVSDADRQGVQAYYAKFKDLKVESTRLILIAERAFGPGCSKLPRHGVSQGAGNNQSLSDYDTFKYKPKGKNVKDFRDGSVIEDTIAKALVSAELLAKIEEYEKRKGALGKNPKVPPHIALPLSQLREEKRVMVARLVDVVILSQNIAAINKMEKVGADWLNTDSSKGVKPDMSDLHAATECVMLFAKKDGQMAGMSVAVSPATIRGLRPWYAETQEHGGNLDELLSSKEPAEPRNTQAEAFDVTKWEFEQFELALDAVNEYSEQFIGPSATKQANEKFVAYLLSDKGAEVLGLLFEFVGNNEESIVSKDVLKSKNNSNKLAFERAQGGEANRQRSAA